MFKHYVVKEIVVLVCDNMKIKKKRSKMFLKEKGEHPSFSVKQIEQILSDHKRKPRKG